MAEMLFIEDAQVIFKNFSGKEGPYNDEGVRSFAVVLEDVDLASKLREDGWNVKPQKPREDDPDNTERYYLPVAVSYKNIPPSITMFMGDVKGKLSEDNVGELDCHKILKADVYIAPSVYYSRVTGEDKVKAYLRSMAVFVEVDPIAAKYAGK